MHEKNLLAEDFEARRGHLRAVAYRMLGSRSEAEDAVQEAWLRLSRSDAGEVTNLGGWLTTVVARVCLDMLRSRKARREEAYGIHIPEPAVGQDAGITFEQEADLAEAVGLAPLVVLEQLAPAERLAFVLHDMFAVPFEEIARIVERSPSAARQLASRARRRVQGAATATDVDLGRQREIVGAFLAASRNSDFEALLTVLDPDVVFRADETAVRLGALAEIHGAPGVADTFKGRATSARPILVDGTVGLAVVMRGQLRVVLRLAMAAGRIAAIEAIADPDSLRRLDLVSIDT